MFFIRSFNRFINSKTGHPLLEGNYRGDYEPWEKFETLLKEAIVELGYEYVEQLETPLLPTTANANDIQIHAHKTKRDLPDADFFYAQMHLKELFTLDTCGWGVDHSQRYEPSFIEAINPELAEALRLRLLNHFLTSGASKHSQPQIGASLPAETFELDKDYILVPLQTPRDYVLEHHANLSVLDFLRLVAEWAIAQKISVCFKIHPYSLKDLKIQNTLKNYASKSRYVDISSRNIHELISASSGVFVINSGVGFEALIHGKPVVTFGNCDYQLATFSADRRSLNQAQEYIQNYSPEQQAFASKFIYNYYTNHAVSLADDCLQDSKLRLKHYLQSQIQEGNLHERLRSTSPDDKHETLKAFDIVYVLNEQSTSWILGAICREIDQYHSGSSFYHNVEDGAPPPAKVYFFAHYLLWHQCLADYPWLRFERSLVSFTHPRNLSILHPKVITSLNQASKIICMCSLFSEFLVKQGVARSLIEVCIDGADPALFQPHQRGGGVIGFCSSFYERKNPELIVKIIKHMPHRQFLLLGRKWQDYEHQEALLALNNFSYVEAAYADYPAYYAKMDVFVSPSRVEGGPIPLIESMMCNVVPVVSRTGLADDLIVHGKNGFIFDIDEPVEVVCDLIEQAYELRGDIRTTVEHLTWERKSRQIQSLFPKDDDSDIKLTLLYKYYDLIKARAESYEIESKQLRSRLKKLESNSLSLKYLLSEAASVGRRKIKDRMRRHLKSPLQ